MPRGYGGVAVLWRKEIDHLVQDLPDGGNRIKCIEIKGNVPILVVSVYMPCRGLKENVEDFADCTDELNEIILKHKSSHKILLGGDRNEDIRKLPTSQRARHLLDLLEDHILEISNAKPTYTGPCGTEVSTIDYFIYDQKLSDTLLTVARLDYLVSNVSDHIPLVCEVNFSMKIVKEQDVDERQKIRKVIREKVDLHQYKETVKDRISDLRLNANSTAEIDRAVQKLNDILVMSALGPEPKPKVARRRRKPKLRTRTPKICRAVSEKKMAFARWKAAGRPQQSNHPTVQAKKLTTENLRYECRLESA